MTFTSGLVYNWVTILVATVCVVIAYMKWKFSYWQRQGLETLPPSIPFGNMNRVLMGKCPMSQHFKNLYDHFRAKGLKHGGHYFLWRASYIPIDPEILKYILVKDFQHFVNHGLYANEDVDPLSGHLFNLEDQKWRNMRTKLTPTFTSGKMKMMFQTFADCTVGLKEILDECANDKKAIEIKDLLARFTTDIIGSCAFGLECNSLRNPSSEFRNFGRRIFESTPRERIAISVKSILPRDILRKFRIKFSKPDVEKFFMDVVKKTVDYRENNNVQRKDFMQLLIQLKNKGSVEHLYENVNNDSLEIGKSKKSGESGENLTMNELAAQAFVFFAAGFETSSTTMSFALYELAVNPEIQDKVRQEINSVLSRHDNKLTYDGIMEMTYLDKTISESLRKYPPVPILPRVCTKDYKIPGTTLTIRRGTQVRIPVIGLHHDPIYYPNPEKFDPERFSEENKSKRPACTWIPFGEGPRLCIGLRFGLLQAKVGLAAILKDFRISLDKRTKVPLEIDKKSFILAAEGGVWLEIEAIS